MLDLQVVLLVSTLFLLSAPYLPLFICQSQKRQNDLCSFPKQTIQYHVIQAYAPTSAEEAKVELFYEDLQDLLGLTPKKDVLFIIGDWNAGNTILKYTSIKIEIYLQS